MKNHAAKYVVTLAALLAAAAGIALGSGGLAAAEPNEKTYEPHPKTIVEVTGDKWNGFGIHYYDGTEDFPPTNSEAKAECSEYSTRLERVKCRTEVRVWYRDLGDLKRSINYQQSLRK
jgi:hypothetical protein